MRDDWFLDLREDLRLEFGEQSTTPVPVKTRLIKPNYGLSNVTADRQLTTPPEHLGWFVKEDNFSVSYFAHGHDDPFLASVLTLLAKAKSDLNLGEVQQGKKTAIEDSWQAFGTDTSMGMCVSCHSVDNLSGKIHWQAGADQIRSNGLTTFSHAPHITQKKLSDCHHCHEIDPQSDFMSSYAADSSEPPHSNFKSMTKESCTGCHNAAVNKDSCTTCHNYHGHAPRPSGQLEIATLQKMLDFRRQKSESRRVVRPGAKTR